MPSEQTEVHCEVCEQLAAVDALTGCEDCGRLFGPCCNSIQDVYCVDYGF